MLKRPQWVKEKIEGKEKQIPLQMTVKKKYPPQPDNSYMEMRTISATNTGAGVDGEVQPGKMVDIQVHEGEGIIPNNAMQGLTEDEFQGLVETLSSGDIDKNKLREAIGMPTVSEYQTGGITYKGDVPSASEIPDLSTDITNRRSLGVPSEGATAVSEPPPTKEEYLRMRFPNFGSAKDNTIQTSTVTREKPTAPTIRVAIPEQETIATSTIPAESREKDTTEAVTDATAEETPVIKAPPPQEETIKTEEIEKETPPPTNAPKDEITEETVTEAKTSPAGEAVRAGLQKILAEIEGVSDLDRKITNFYLQNIDASNAANLRILESQISADPDMSDQAKRAAIAGIKREAAATRSEEVGKLAISAEERASQAARDLITYGQDIRKYDEITKPMSELEMKELEQKIGTTNVDLINSMIDRNWSLEKVNNELAKQGLAPLTRAEYNSILSTGATGERNWNRKLALAESLLATPDPEGNNIATAATMFSELYDGVDIDFSGLLTQQNAATFSQGLSQMATYVDAGMKIDEAMEFMKGDGTFEMLGGDEELITKLYAASHVNAIDQQWKEIETSDIYQAMLKSDDAQERQNAADIKEFYIQSVMGLLDFDTVHEYKITKEGTGEVLGSTYATSAEEAQKIADGMGAGNIVTDTGNVEFVVKEEVEEGVTGTDIKARWETFKEDIPGDVNAAELYPRWEVWQKAHPDGDYEEFLESPVNQIYTSKITNTEDFITDPAKSDLLISAYKEDPDIVKEKGYYWDPITVDELNGKFETKTGGFAGTGETKTTINPTVKAELESSKGKMTEVTYKGDTIVGQVMDINYGPGSVTMIIKKLDGTKTNVTVYNSDHGSYRPQPEYWGEKA